MRALTGCHLDFKVKYDAVICIVLRIVSAYGARKSRLSAGAELDA